MISPVPDTPRLDPARILIVEDEGLIAGHIAARLEKTGYSVAGIVTSSADALSKIPFINPDLVLMDIHLKGDIDGIETAIAIRDRFDIPVIYLTAHTDQSTIDRAKTTGAFGFLTKPVHHTNLATSIEMALHKHKAEREARQRSAWIETVLETMADAVAVIDNDWKVQFLNRPAELLTGWTRIDAKNLELGAILPLIDPKTGFRHEKPPAHFPDGTYAVSRSGQLLPVEGEITASFDNGKLVGRVITFRDSSIRQQEERRKRQTEKMEAVGRLAAGIAHDFNNLLFVILGFADQMALAPMDFKNSRLSLKEIKKAAETAVGIIRQLLQYGRPEAVEPQNVSLNDVVSETKELWRRLAGGAVRWETDLHPALENVRADPGQLKQVLMNLVANARDAMPRGGVLTIRTANVEASAGDARGMVALSVTDTGTGMTQETIDRLFEPYFTTKGTGKGTGLGLPIVHRIISDLGGSIHAESTVGKGAAFTIQLPSEGAADLALVSLDEALSHSAHV